VLRRSLLLALGGVAVVVAPYRVFTGGRGVAQNSSFRPMIGSTSATKASKPEATSRLGRVKRAAFGVELLTVPVFMEWPALAAGACAVALMLGVQMEHSLQWEQGFWREWVAARRRLNLPKAAVTISSSGDSEAGKPLKIDLPCNTEEGRALLDTLNECGQDGFFRHLQTQLLTLREDVRKEMRYDKEMKALNVPTTEDEDMLLLRRRMDNLTAKENRERILTDIFATGTWIKLRSNGLKTVTDVDHFNGLDMHLGDSIVNLPADVALEVRAFVFNCLGAQLGSRTVLRLKRSNAAGLLLGAVSVGYSLARMTLKSYSSVSAVVQKGWQSESAYVMASNWAGRMMHMQPDSQDALEQYASLREASMDVQAELLPTECKRVDGGHAEVVRFSSMHQPAHLLSGDIICFTVEDFRTILGYGCSVGFTLQQWESKMASWFLEHLP